MPVREIDLAPGEGAEQRSNHVEVGYIGLKQKSGVIFEEEKLDLRYPKASQTFQQMMSDPVVSAGVQEVIKTITKIPYSIVSDVDSSEEDEDKAEFIRQNMDDMEHSFDAFIREAATMVIYGHAVTEKVWRRRLSRRGSKYNDGLWGWKKLPARSQSTITEWEFSDDGREFLGIKQTNAWKNDLQLQDTFIPRDKFLLFTTGSTRGNPQGQSPLTKAWSAWKQKLALQEIELLSVSKDMAGTMLVKIPAQYLAPNASDEEVLTRENFERIIRNWQRNEQSGLMIPSDVDDLGNPLFDVQIMGVTGGKTYDTGAIISRYDNQILSGLFADLLVLSLNAQGSYALAEVFEKRANKAIQAYISEIEDVITGDLIAETYRKNGWDDRNIPKFKFGIVDKIAIEEFSKGIQRCASTATLVRSPKNINYIAEQLGLPDRVSESMSQDELNELLGQETSRASDGMANGMGEGTSTSQSGEDTSSNNLDNTA